MLSGSDPCPCDAGAAYSSCCQPLHQAGQAGLGVTAVQLMRARYSAYVIQDHDFLLASWHDTTRPTELAFDPNVEWIGLEVTNVEGGSAFDATGVVAFRARFRRGAEHMELVERSTFVRDAGRWLYIDGE